MNYLLSVVLLPMLVGSAIACAALLGPLRHRAAIIECCVAYALAIAFLITFVREVDLAALLRQLPVELKDDDAPFERWHQLGLVALLLAVVSPTLALLTAAVPAQRKAIVMTATLLAACGVAALVAFPGASNSSRALFAVVCALSSGAIAMCGLRTAMCALAVSCVGMAVCAVMTGFPSLAIMCVAVAGTAGSIALVACWRRSPRMHSVAGAISVVSGILVGVAVPVAGALLYRMTTSAKPS
ncbi:MAG: hypothetical protein NT059_08025 [Planctomycetota bacterium]|nr:hypothetical protein [Planctomycetota bacterium]